MAVIGTNLLAEADIDGNSSMTTSSISPTANNLLLAAVVTRTNITTDPNEPTMTGAGLTWVVVYSFVFDTTSSTRKRLTVFRALSSSPSSGALTIDLGGQNQTHIAVSVDQFSGVDLTGTNGSGAIVQSAFNADVTVTTSSLTVTLGAFSDAGNATYGAFGTGSEQTPTVGTGFAELGNALSEVAYPRIITEYKQTNDTSVDMSFSGNLEMAGIAIEIKAYTKAMVRATSSNSSTTGTAISVSAPTGTTAGDVVVVFVHGNGQTTIVDNNGATPFTEDLNDFKPNTSYGHTVSVFSRRIQSGDPSTYNFTLGASNRWSIIAVTVQDPNASTIYDVAVTTYNQESDSTTVDAPSITTLTDGALHICMGCLDDAVVTVIGYPSGYGNTVAENDQPMGVASKIITTAGATGTQQFEFSGTSARMAVSLAIKPEVATATVSHLTLLGVG